MTTAPGKICRTSSSIDACGFAAASGRQSTPNRAPIAHHDSDGNTRRDCTAYRPSRASRLSTGTRTGRPTGSRPRSLPGPHSSGFAAANASSDVPQAAASPDGLSPGCGTASIPDITTGAAVADGTGTIPSSPTAIAPTTSHRASAARTANTRDRSVTCPSPVVRTAPSARRVERAVQIRARRENEAPIHAVGPRMMPRFASARAIHSTTTVTATAARLHGPRRTESPYSPVRASVPAAADDRRLTGAARRAAGTTAADLVLTAACLPSTGVPRSTARRAASISPSTASTSSRWAASSGKPPETWRRSWASTVCSTSRPTSSASRERKNANTAVPSSSSQLNAGSPRMRAACAGVAPISASTSATCSRR